ncbi:L-serine ammonia-lyase, iron-sulfur-dependent, subunit alpha [Cohnella sp. REN36]|uniref:L-serine ammonia-lyase, iron-sulfur-dependent, subunit alpha n=1 Tax=Cohnella sp. REN36 TaxID=2887347 RepID=UPI001D13FDCF|nr:L-serine ammonia-lyase, iron-sulfur-dependent, subunit alpha [Cohnella sp. REN36]
MNFATIAELAARCEEAGQTISAYMLAQQSLESGRSPAQERQQMAAYYDIMKEAVRRGITTDTTSRSGLTGGDARRVMAMLDGSGGDTSAGSHATRAMAYALAVSEVNASMGRIVATPTAGSCGILPGVLVSSQERYGWPDDRMVDGLFCAGALGYVIANNAFISGAEGGCQAEVGSAIAMAAGALVELRGGTPMQCAHAVGLALKNTLGLVCDPVAGLVEVPCIVRNGMGAVNALAAADLALAGVRSAIPADEVVGAMRDIGAAMPETLRETGKGGLAATPTGQRIAEALFGEERP